MNFWLLVLASLCVFWRSSDGQLKLESDQDTLGVYAAIWRAHVLPLYCSAAAEVPGAATQPVVECHVIVEQVGEDERTNSTDVSPLQQGGGGVKILVNTSSLVWVKKKNGKLRLCVSGL